MTNNYIVNLLEQLTIDQSFEIEEVQTQQSELNLAFTSRTNFWIGVFMLFILIIPNSIIAPLTLDLPAKDTFIKSSWRFQGCMILSVLLLGLMYLLKWDGIDFKKDFSLKVLTTQLFLSFFMFLWVTGFILGCSLTLTSHADIMYCSGGVFIFFASIVTCKSVHKLEICGYLLYFIGVYFMFTDSFAMKTGMDRQSYLGDLVAFIGAGASAIFTYYNKKHKLDLHPMVSLTQMFILCCIHQFIFFPFLSNSNAKFFTLDLEYGVFGWINDSYAFFLVICINAPITGVIGNIGYYSAFKYFPIQIIAGVMLIEPFTAQIAAILLGQDKIPGLKTIMGCCIITIGFLLSGLGAKLISDEVVAQKIDEPNSQYLECSKRENL